ncbi:hypothetical protein GX51_06630 [Blastomyces parvus]|uniref:Zn(2)-C6 fungal-type domain-containing protein n=1 Tax=Blastomyces parvus TaxID=2060905 RepID=A0A2B7WQK7_9EURO|nr:hypothetical protein GX51_06630 [Blastomyces parvus]
MYFLYGQNAQTGRPVHQLASTVDVPVSNKRAKRIQVGRACDRCRSNRIKCDNEVPCQNCKARGYQCSKPVRGRVREREDRCKASSRDIEKLKARVKELEGQLEEAQSRGEARTVSSVQPHHGDDVNIINIDKNEDIGLREEPRQVGDGVWANNTNSQVEQRHFYGPSSQFFFTSNISSSLGLQEQRVYPNSLNNVFTSPGGLKRDAAEEEKETSTRYGHVPVENLTRTQESRFLSLFWESYNCIIPIVDELSFMRHYESLWTSAPNCRRPRPRKPSPIVDIVVALCMQYGMTLIPPQSGHGHGHGHSQAAEPDISTNDPSIAGRGYYRRCQASLTAELERPSIVTVQCHVLSAIYLQNASFLNMAQHSLAIAIRLAYILGMNRPPSRDLTRCEQELRRRLWWAIFSLESKMCIAQGRPSLIDTSHMAIGFPKDDWETEQVSTVHFTSPQNDITWLSCQAHCVKLAAAARTLHTSFHRKRNDMLIACGEKDSFGNSLALEELAKFFSQKFQQHLENWAQNVPQGLITERKRDGTPLSADRSALKIDPAAPQWLQRQRLVLELNYHDQVVTACRSFIRLPSPANLTKPNSASASASATTPPIADSHCVRCASHAVACTNIIDQMLRETDLLTGWYDAYKFQWNAALALVGFCLAYPIHGQTMSVRRAIDDAIGVFEIFGANLALARSAAGVMRDLAAKVDGFIRGMWPSASSQSSRSSGFVEMEIEKTQQDNQLGTDDLNHITSSDVFLAPGVSSPRADGFTKEFPSDLFSFSETQFMDENGGFIDLWSDFITGL